MNGTSRFNFTKTSLAALPAAVRGRRVTYFDTRTRGLTLVVTAAGRKTFYLRRKVDGRSERILIGRFPDDWSVERARTRADEINASIGNGENPAEVRRARRAEMTLDDLFNEYMARNGPHLRRPDKPRNNYRLYLGHWGSRKLSTIKHHQVDALHKELARAKSNVTANIALKLLHVMFNKAINEWRIWKKDNPAHGIRKLREISRDRFLLAQEMPFFMLAVQLEPSADLRDFVQLALLTGARRSNLLTMRWEQVNDETRVWCIPMTKNGTPQMIPLSAEALELLGQRSGKSASPWVFPGSGMTAHMVEPKRGWRRVVERTRMLRLLHAVAEHACWDHDQTQAYTERALVAPVRASGLLRDQLIQLGVDPEPFELKHLRFHDLRRTLGSWQARTGASLAIIGKSLNHQSPASTTIYARLDLDPVRASIGKATAAMWAAAGISNKRHSDTRGSSDHLGIG